ncbi:hypothetical protein L0666_16175 [Octadecabacter sp. CECT 8868]|uniref:hypothetical protein n=1 Tax=Octadecabacter algicola TaxID=2909342 RepID=UPI001F3E75C5|nr:hypothetical protein [Octadecabacter algicola]MCF2906531.1 hypothetical protein [Octadecabacter algicola]
MIKPVMMGALMGLMMIWMLHGLITGDSQLSGSAQTVFIGAHVVLVLVALSAALFSTRLSPRLRGWMDRLHRPSLHHFAAMLGGAAMVVGAIHLSIHGLGGV